MRTALAYRPTRGPLQAASPLPAILFLGSFAFAAFAFASPFVLVAAGLAVCVAGLAARARRALAAAARFGVTLGIAIVVVNVLVTERGDTTLVRGWDLPVLGSTDVTLESLVAGGILALRILVVVAAFAVYSACVDPDRVLRLVRPVARRSALTATLVSRAVPLAAADLGRLRDAARLRGPDAAPATRAVLAGRLLTRALDRSVDAAATLELRGFSSAAGPTAAPRARSRHDLAFLVAGLAAIGAATLGLAAGIAEFGTYPTIAIDADAATLALALSLPALAAAPFALARARSWRSPLARVRRSEAARA